MGKRIVGEKRTNHSFFVWINTNCIEIARVHIYNEYEYKFFAAEIQVITHEMRLIV